jgi:hypothetical protein
VIDESTSVLQGFLERGLTGDDAARRRLGLTRDRPMLHAGRFLNGRYAREGSFAQNDKVVPRHPDLGFGGAGAPTQTCRFVQSEVGESLKADFDLASSPVHAFVNDFYELGPRLDERKEVVRTCLNEYLVRAGRRSLSDALITTRLRAMNSKFEGERKVDGGKPI